MKRAKGAKFATNRAEEWLRRARQCLEIEPTFRTRKRRRRLSHLAQVNQHIAELAVQIRRQRVIVKQALDTGESSKVAESLLHALEESLGAFEKHRIFLLSEQKSGADN